jgi:asparagine synthase (glutamine-hydrolysing)
MSGIAGVYFLDGQPVTADAIGRMTGAMTHRGPDGLTTWHDDAVGLGHAMLHATPESLHETQPLVHSSGDFVLTADARIDNRGALIRALRPPRPDDRSITDAELILAAYERWGTDCPKHLLGAFAFAIWDGRARRLFCARDHFGVKPLYIAHAPDCLFGVASEIKALLDLDAVPRTINTERVVDFLLMICLNSEYTFYKHIQRLPPGHYVSLSPRDVKKRPYWSLTSASTGTYGRTDEENVEAFRAIFRDAVARRLRASRPVGAELSGGLDSSSVVAEASHLLSESGRRLQTFSSIYDTLPQCDEREYIHAVIDRCGCEGHFFPGDEGQPVSALQHLTPYIDEPFQAPNISSSFPLLNGVKQSDVRVLLSGHGGDETVSQGWGLLKELALGGHWWMLAQEVWGASKLYKGESSFWQLLKGYVEYGLRHRPSFAASVAYRMVHTAGNVLKETASEEEQRIVGILADGLTKGIDVEERIQAFKQQQAATARTERERHLKVIQGCLQPWYFETLDGVTASFSVEKRYPFWDKRVVEFCLGLPAKEKLKRGWGRLILRRAMASTLPEHVCWRRDKISFTEDLFRGLTRRDAEALKKWVAIASTCDAYIDGNVLEKTYRRVSCDRYSLVHLITILNSVSVCMWVDHFVD